MSVLYEAKRRRSCYQGTDNRKSKMDRGKAEVLGKHRREEETRAERGGRKGREELEGLVNHRRGKCNSNQRDQHMGSLAIQ